MSEIPELQADQFSAFFQSLYGRTPFQWQTRLAKLACHGDWPRFIKLPTSSGKTSCLDIAVFALAHQACRRHSYGMAIDAPRRIFFVVDRRIIVNEAYLRASHLTRKLKTALDQNDSPIHSVAKWLQSLTDNQHAPPLDCVELRGGIYRDDAWVRSLLQPTIVTSTVDQVGSRLLFRGYGVSDRNLPIHAALTANDSLILLDEAHCSKPFSQTMESIARFRDARLSANEPARWAEQPIRTPFRFVEMTATPRDASSDDVFQLESADYQADLALEERHGCPKPIQIIDSSAKGGKLNDTLATHLVAQAELLAKGGDNQPQCLRIAIVVNRVACARKAFKDLKKNHAGRVELMIGRMRPTDRDRLVKKLQDRFKSDSEEQLTEPHFVVATQCLEVGADFDFDGMVCQCASLDALRQRFGRLNRLGKSPYARGVIVMAEGDKAPRKPDPIYGESLPATWEWLKQKSKDDVIDFGIRALDAVVSTAWGANSLDVDLLSAPSLDAPVLMPAHLDLLCQTAPRPALEPDVAPYLHGPNRGVPEVRLCWRADLPEFAGTERIASWLDECCQTLAVCPPSSAECLSVPLPQFKAWLLGQDDSSNDSGDVLGEDVSEDSEIPPTSGKSKSRLRPDHRRGVIWNGRHCRAASGAADELSAVHPNALIVLPATAGGWTSLGYVPDAPAEPDNVQNESSNIESSIERKRDLARIDEATAAFRQSRDRLILRVHRDLMTSAADNAALAGLWEFLDDENRAWHHSELRRAEEMGTDEPPSGDSKSLEPGRSESLLVARAALASVKLAKHAPMVRYPGGFVVTGPRLSARPELPRASFDDDFDEHNIDAVERQSLADHLADVAAETERLVANLGLEPALASALIAAAERHDLGKADPRFQAMLLGSSLDMAWMQPKLWAKSSRGPAAREVLSATAASARSSDVDQLPIGFRHEMLSLDFAQLLQHDLSADSAEVMLHAIAAHHGHARPLAPVVFDEAPPAVSLERLFPSSTVALSASISTEHRLRLPSHRLDSGISERFSKLNRRFGWWGLAWLESTLRLADWVASAQPNSNVPLITLQSIADKRSRDIADYEIPLSGLNATNPLAFLAALGLLRLVTAALSDWSVRMKWRSAGTWHPILLTNRVLSQHELVSILHKSLQNRESEDHFTRLGKNINVLRSEFRQAILDAISCSHQNQRTSVDFFAAYGSDALVSPNDGVTIQDTALRTMAGAGHQHFLETMRNLIKQCQPEHLEKAVFRRWGYDDPTQALSLRFDPIDDNRYALRWRNPSGDPERKTSGSMLGANRLAIEAIPLIVTAPGEKLLQTTGFTGYRSNDTFFHWPIWEVPLPISVVQSLLVSRDILVKPPLPEQLRSRGVAVVMSSQRITVGKVRNFSPGKSLLGALHGS